MPRIDLKKQIKRLPCLAVQRQHIIGYIMMRNGHPLRASCAKRPAVNEQRRLAAHIQRHDNPLSLSRLGQNDPRAHPHVFPCMSPFSSLFDRHKAAVFRLFRRQMLHCCKAFKAYFIQRTVKILRQGSLPMLQPSPVFRVHQCHIPLPFIFDLTAPFRSCG